jgi:hypothetical protein
MEPDMMHDKYEPWKRWLFERNMPKEPTPLAQRSFHTVALKRYVNYGKLFYTCDIG